MPATVRIGIEGHVVSVGIRAKVVYSTHMVVMLMCEDGDLDQFLADAQQLVVKKATTTYATSAGANVTVFPKEGKKNEVASPVSSQSKAKQSPGYYGGYGNYGGGYGGGYGGYGGKAIDYDEEIFGKRDLTGTQRADWWND